MAVVEVEHLRKAYGALVAVDDVGFAVARGEIVGILGPNGAGKTTAVECVTGVRVPDAGTVRVLGLDPQVDRREVRERVGVQLQESALPAKLRVGEALELYRSFYRHPADVGELVEALGLADKQRAYFRDLSGGQKQRLAIALALIGRPEIAVLDELTTGLDPQARRDVWDFVEVLRVRGVTVLLVTHSMEEAERLCDRVLLIDEGRVVAAGTPSDLAARVTGGTLVRFRPSAPVEDAVLTRLPTVSAVVRQGEDVVVSGSGDVVTDVVLALDAAGSRATAVRVEAATLEDAFIALTGHRLHEPEGRVGRT